MFCKARGLLYKASSIITDVQPKDGCRKFSLRANEVQSLRENNTLIQSNFRDTEIRTRQEIKTLPPSSHFLVACSAVDCFGKTSLVQSFGMVFLVNLILYTEMKLLEDKLVGVALPKQKLFLLHKWSSLLGQSIFPHSTLIRNSISENFGEATDRKVYRTSTESALLGWDPPLMLWNRLHLHIFR